MVRRSSDAMFSGTRAHVRSTSSRLARLAVALALSALSCATQAYDFRRLQGALEALHPQTQPIWERRALGGDAFAQNVVGISYKHGIGVAQDHGAAHLWFHLAASRGEADAQFNLALIYDSRAEGPYKEKRAAPADDVEAFKWYRLSAEQGHTPAQVKLARLYADGGGGIVRDSVQAYRWLYAASLSGDPAARRLLSRVATRMTPEQVREAEMLAWSWLGRRQAK